MRVAFHLTIPPPARPGLDAVVQEAQWLARRFDGGLHYLYPFRRFSRLVPKALCGLRQRRLLESLDGEVDVHHLFSGDLIDYPALRRLEKPVVYALTTGLGPDRLPRWRSLPGWIARLVTAGEETRDVLTRRGLRRVEHMAPAIDVERFSHAPLPFGRELVLLAGSAPWDRRQFRSKGFEALLAVAELLPNLRLVLLWRGVLTGEIKRRVRRHRLDDRVEIIDQQVDVDRVLARVHAAVVLAEQPGLVKAFPHSLLEALAAGKPIVTSRGLAIAGLAKRHRCGEVLGGLGVPELTAALKRLMAEYPRYEAAARGLDMSPFSRERLLADYGRIYDQVVEEAG